MPTLLPGLLGAHIETDERMRAARCSPAALRLRGYPLRFGLINPWAHATNRCLSFLIKPELAVPRVCATSMFYNYSNSKQPRRRCCACHLDLSRAPVDEYSMGSRRCRGSPVWWRYRSYVLSESSIRAVARLAAMRSRRCWPAARWVTARPGGAASGSPRTSALLTVGLPDRPGFACCSSEAAGLRRR